MIDRGEMNGLYQKVVNQMHKVSLMVTVDYILVGKKEMKRSHLKALQ